MKIHWLLEYHFLRGNLTYCQKLIEEKKIDNELEIEYSTFVQVSKLQFLHLNKLKIHTII